VVVPVARHGRLLIKGLPSALFFDFRDSLSVTNGDVKTEGGCQRINVSNG
jgi:hypothetical protein